jgi:outer membrane immunogenic protein
MEAAMKRSIFPAVAATALCIAAPACAADMAAMLKAPPAAPGFNWSGSYFGGNIGGGWATQANTVAVAFPGSGFPAGTAFSSIDSSGVVGGVQGGFNFQYRSPVVLGVEGEYMWSDLTGSATTPSPTTAGLNTTIIGKVSDIALVAGRAGWAVNTVLFYVKAGAVVGADQHKWSFNP